MRTARTVYGVIEGIIGSESLRCSQIAAFSPLFKGKETAYKRVRRLVHGEAVQRPGLSDQTLTKVLQSAGMEQLRGAEEVWIALDSSEEDGFRSEPLEYRKVVRSVGRALERAESRL